MGIGSMQGGKQKGNRWEMNRVREGGVGGDWEYAGRETEGKQVGDEQGEGGVGGWGLGVCREGNRRETGGR